MTAQSAPSRVGTNQSFVILRCAPRTWSGEPRGTQWNSSSRVCGNRLRLRLVQRRRHTLCERLVDGADRTAEFAEGLFDVDLLPLECRNTFLELLSRVQDLRPAAVMHVVEVEDLADLGERKADAASAQDENDAGAVARRVDPRLSAARRRDQPFIFVEAQRAGRDAELLGQLPDGEGAVCIHEFLHCGRGLGGPVPTLTISQF